MTKKDTDQGFVDPETENKAAEPKPSAEKTFTQAELDAAISKAAVSIEDKIEKRYSKLFEQKMVEIEEQAIKKAQMTEEERYTQKMKDWEDRLNQRQAEIEREALSAEVNKELAKRNLPLSLAESLVLLGDIDQAKAKIEQIDTDYKASVTEAVKSQFRSDPPKASITPLEADVNPFAKEANEADLKRVEAPNPWASTQ